MGTDVVEREVVEIVTERERRASVLEAAALEIEVRGWATGDAMARNGSVCLLGGIACALGEDPKDCVQWPDYAAVFGGPIFQVGMFTRSSLDDSLYGWNDNTSRSADEVTFLLRWRAEEIRDGR